MSQTITVTGDYVVQAGDAARFQDVTAFSLQGDAAMLDDRGRIHAAFGTAGPHLGVAAAGGAVLVEAGGQVSIVSSAGGVLTGLDGALDSFDNAGAWRVDADGGSARGVVLTSETAFDNSGRLEALGVRAAALHMAAGGGFNNSGLIEAAAHGGDAQGVILDETGDVTFALENAGRIVADGDAGSIGTYAVGLTGTALHPWSFDNTGVIASNGYAVLALPSDAQSAGILHNAGRMDGLVQLGGGGDQVVNTGAIVGDVDLGAGDDAYDGRTGQMKGIDFGKVAGGAGADVLDGGKGFDQLHGDAIDDTEANSDGADLLKGHKGNDAIWGDGGADTIVGGGGGDLMWGGGGADTFVFHSHDNAPGTTVDHIMDLENQDVIDLSAIDADTTQAGDQAFHLVTSFTGHAGELMLVFEDQDQPFTAVEIDTDGDGVSDFDWALQLRDNHAGFTNFVL